MQSQKLSTKSLQQLVESDLQHVYSDRNLTFNDLVAIFTKASNGTLEHVTEKIDGSNLLFSVNNKQEIRIARNNSDMLYGGLLPHDILQRYSRFVHVGNAFAAAFNVLQSSIKTLNIEEIDKLFDNLSKWYSIEVIYHNADHVIDYDGNHIVFHEFPVYAVKNNKINEIQHDISILTSNIDKMQSAIKYKNWKLHAPFFVKLQNIANGKLLQTTLDKLNDLIVVADINYESTIRDYLIAVAKSYAMKLHIAEPIAIEVAKRMLNIRGAMNVVQLKRAAKHFDEEIDECLQKSTLQKLSLPLELLITEFASDIIRSLTPNIPCDVSATKQKLNTAIQTLRNNDQISQSVNFINHVKKVGNIDDIVPVEGIIFRYKGQHYKFTGQFASANQLLNIFKKTQEG